MAELLLKEEVFRIVGAAMEVYNEKGYGFLEGVYHECMELELAARDIPFASHCKLQVSYKGRLLEKKYEADFLCFDEVVVEIKAADCLTSVDEGQLLNYLKATGKRVGVLINFGAPGHSMETHGPLGAALTTHTSYSCQFVCIRG